MQLFAEIAAGIVPNAPRFPNLAFQLRIEQPASFGIKNLAMESRVRNQPGGKLASEYISGNPEILPQRLNHSRVARRPPQASPSHFRAGIDLQVGFKYPAGKIAPISPIDGELGQALNHLLDQRLPDRS